MKFYHEFREANLMCLLETWLMENDGDPEIPGFTVVHGDRSLDETGKRRGGGVCVYVNRHWCCNITVKEQLCTGHLQLLTVALRPYYLPREFNQLFITALYIHLPLTSSWQARVWAESSTGCHRYHRTPPALYWGTSTSAN